MKTIFERIVDGDIPCHKVWENERFLAFLDIRPVAPGHCLVVPKAKVDPVFSMDDKAYSELFLAAKRVAERLKQVVECERVCLAVVGFEVPHTHIHLIPCRSMVDFPWPGGKPVESEELRALAQKIYF
ncbi:MAG: HIT family protein [Deltaproteobacteria bacterium CG11_big_fil_rev_8_21_14_0_20_45_16]|nr:MAG: HIT family protein [Deltaproteobacteria bacterium CG11_big_fil_rev_8_21_14_0_20_45_16]